MIGWNLEHTSRRPLPENNGMNAQYDAAMKFQHPLAMTENNYSSI